MVDAIRPQDFPPDVVSGEQRRRWELCAMSAWMTYGYDSSLPVDSGDQALLRRVTRVYYESNQPTGDGFLSDDDRALLRSRGVL